MFCWPRNRRRNCDKFKNIFQYYLSRGLRMLNSQFTQPVAGYLVCRICPQNRTRKSTTSILSSLPCSIWPLVYFFGASYFWTVGVTGVSVNGNRKRGICNIILTKTLYIYKPRQFLIYIATILAISPLTSHYQESHSWLVESISSHFWGQPWHLPSPRASQVSLV